jgi:hypothetical protein
MRTSTTTRRMSTDRPLVSELGVQQGGRALSTGTDDMVVGVMMKGSFVKALSKPSSSSFACVRCLVFPDRFANPFLQTKI